MVSLGWPRFAACLSAAVVIALGVALVPGAQAKGGFKSCGDKQFQYQESFEGEPPTTVTVTAKKVSVQGTSCDAADTFLNLALEPGRDSGANFPLHYECKTGTFHVPAGYRPQVCTKPGKTIRFGRSGL